jgi:hypothetical protein
VSLRAFHIVFVAFSIILAAFVAAWANSQYRTGHDLLYAVTALGALAIAGGLAVYGAAFLKKTRNL